MSANPVFTRLSSPKIGEHGRSAEKLAAKRLGARQTPASGALASAKGDFEKDGFLIENKATTSGSYSLSQEVWLKIYNEALAVGKNPALAVQFVTPSGSSRRDSRMVVIPEWLFQEVFGLK